MKREEYVALADQNLVAAIRHRFEHIPTGQLVERDGALMFSVGRGEPNGHFNGVFRMYASDEPAELIADAQRFFKDMNTRFDVWVQHEQADADLERVVQREGFTLVREPGVAIMAVDERVGVPEIPPGVEIKAVADKGQLGDFTRVVESAFNLTTDLSSAMFSTIACVATDNVVAYVGYDHGLPVSAALAIVDEGVGGIYWVGTMADSRNRGLGEMMTRKITNAAFDLGATAVVLQSSAAGERLYEKLGFKLVSRYRWYRSP